MSLHPRDHNKSMSVMGSQSHSFQTPEKCRIPDHLSYALKGVSDSPFGEFCHNVLPDLLTPNRGKHGAGICDGASLGMGQLTFTSTPVRRPELNQLSSCLRTPERDQNFFQSATAISTPVHRHAAGYDLDTLLGTPGVGDFPPGLRALMGHAGDATPPDCMDLQLFANSPFSAVKLKAPTPKRVHTPSQCPPAPEGGRDARIPGNLHAADGQGDVISISAAVNPAAEAGPCTAVDGNAQPRSSGTGARTRQTAETRRRASSSRRLDFTGASSAEGPSRDVSLPSNVEPIQEDTQKQHSTPVPPTPVQDPANTLVATPTQSSTAQTPIPDHLAKSFGADPEVLRQQLSAVAAQSAGNVEHMQALMQSVYAGINIASKSPVAAPHTPQEVPVSAVKAETADSGKDVAGDDPNESRKHCNCKNSKCLKLYCDCFKVSLYCDGCSCKDCQNTEANATIVRSTMEQIKQRDPEAFEQKIAGDGKGQHRKGCNCKKSHCRKKYCECFQAGVPCGEMCKCANCENMEKPAAKPAAQKASKVRGKSSSRLHDKEIAGGTEVLPASKLDMGASESVTTKDNRRRPLLTGAVPSSSAESLKAQFFGGQDWASEANVAIPDADTIARSVAASKPVPSNRPTTRSLSIGHKRPNPNSSDSDASKVPKRDPGMDRQPSHKLILGDLCCLSPASTNQQPPRLCSPSKARGSPVASLLSAGTAS